jgi:hypothetical protein
VKERYSTTISLTTAIDGVGDNLQAPAALSPGNWPGTHCLAGRLQGRSGRVRKISIPNGIRSPDRSARSKSLYRLSYPLLTALPTITLALCHVIAGKQCTCLVDGVKFVFLTHVMLLLCFVQGSLVLS